MGLSNAIFIGRMAILLALVFFTGLDWKRERLLRQTLSDKELTIANLNTSNEYQSTALNIERAKTGNGIFVIHSPEAGCPEGWTESAELFRLNDEAVAGCVRYNNPAAQLFVDYLRPHEEVALSIGVEMIPEDRGRKL